MHIGEFCFVKGQGFDQDSLVARQERLHQTTSFAGRVCLALTHLTSVWIKSRYFATMIFVVLFFWRVVFCSCFQYGWFNQYDNELIHYVSNNS